MAVVAVAAATAGCGLGPGDSSSGEASLIVTRDYGTEPVVEATESDPTESETVIRFLDRESEITTRFGGGFVQSIDGTEGTISDGHSSDWFFYVNGLESERGAAEVAVRGGDRIWWDYRDWTAAMRVPAVVGSWPEPFAQASTPEDEREPVTVECEGSPEPCERVTDALEAQGVRVGDGDGPRLLVGPWSRVSADPAAAQIDDGPAASGVFARFEGGALVALGVDGAAGAASGARRRPGGRGPPWLRRADLGRDRRRRPGGGPRGRCLCRRRRPRTALRDRGHR